LFFALLGVFDHKISKRIPIINLTITIIINDIKTIMLFIFVVNKEIKKDKVTDIKEIAMSR